MRLQHVNNSTTMQPCRILKTTDEMEIQAVFEYFLLKKCR